MPIFISHKPFSRLSNFARPLSSFSSFLSCCFIQVESISFISSLKMSKVLHSSSSSNRTRLEFDLIVMLGAGVDAVMGLFKLVSEDDNPFGGVQIGFIMK
ncbi:unnamed protein product [Spodoptera exigua]|nr:unnamed protein product [Spodoptera exigua]